MIEPIKKLSRIQKLNRNKILDAALDIFSNSGFEGTTLDQIATAAGLSKPNMIYYFSSKESIHDALLANLLDHWLCPLHAIKADGDPIEELIAYVLLKLELSKSFPRESRLFANEILHGAPRIEPFISGDLKSVVKEKTALIDTWVAKGKINPVDATHLLFSIWSTTQHYADFETQISMLTKKSRVYKSAKIYLEQLFRSLLTPQT